MYLVALLAPPLGVCLARPRSWDEWPLHFGGTLVLSWIIPSVLMGLALGEWDADAAWNLRLAGGILHLLGGVWAVIYLRLTELAREKDWRRDLLNAITPVDADEEVSIPLVEGEPVQAAAPVAADTPRYRPLPVVVLTDEEQGWWDVVSAACPRGADWEPGADALELLFRSLASRCAIPEARLRVFGDPALAETAQVSPRMVFADNGAKGAAVYRHRHFVEYLDYFIKGPALSDDEIGGFVDVLNAEAGPMGVVLGPLYDLVRCCARTSKRSRRATMSAFFRLAVEVGLDDPHAVREAARVVR